MLKALKNHLPSPIQVIHSDIWKEKDIQLSIKRDDLLQIEVSKGDHAFCGNKWRKLKYNLLEAQQLSKTNLLTFGGAFSNHIVATAAAGKIFGFQTIGVIRGESPKQLNPSLRYAKACGMQFHFISRSVYRQKNTPSFIQNLTKIYGDFHLIPEGGTNELALKGASELTQEIKEQLTYLPDYICICCGTGGTLAGIIRGLNGQSNAIGFSALKGDFLTGEVQQLLSIEAPIIPSNWHIQTDYHFGGYAKYKDELVHFINHFKHTHEVRLDPIYTGKMMFGIIDLIKKDYFPKGSSILAIHSGGLQGITGFNERFGNLIDL